MSPSRRQAGRWEKWIAAALLALFLLQSVGSMRRLSTTSDETSHLPAGYTYLVNGEIRLNPQHPPLVKLLCGFPLLFLQPEWDENDPAWTAEPPDEWQFGFDFLYSNDAAALLFWGRMPVVLLGLLLGFYVYRWSREMFGQAGGLLSLFLYSFSPNILAHSHLVTMDLALACFTTMTLYHLRRLCRSFRPGDRIRTGLALGAAMASKFSAVLLGPVVLLLLAVAAGRNGKWKEGAVSAAWVVAAAGLVVWAAYFFTTDPSFYLDGIGRVNADRVADYPYYLMGDFRTGGWWYYFLLAFLFKTPVPSLLLVAAAFLFLRRRPAGGLLGEAFLFVPILLLVVVTSLKADNLGVRYLLPVYPLLFVHAGRLGAWLAESRTGKVAAAVLAVWYVAGTAWSYPNHLAFFNVAVGGPGNGHRLLDDSNIDWGHGLVQLKEYLDRENIDRVRLLHGWNGSPEYWGIRYEQVTQEEFASEHPPPGIYAVTTHLVIRGEYWARESGLPTDWGTRYEPLDRIGYHTWIFRIE
jgi:hypothetical protein